MNSNQVAFLCGVGALLLMPVVPIFAVPLIVIGALALEPDPKKSRRRR